jgi:hypothetical protein
MSAPLLLRVALPWLQSSLAAATAQANVPQLDALRWLGGRGRLRPCAHASWREWLLEPVGGAQALATAPAGPALAARHGQVVDGSGSWCLAQPVHLAAGLDHLRMSALGSARPVDDEEAAALAATVSRHFGAGEPAVVAFVDGVWLLRFNTVLECRTQPPETVVGHDVHDHMPAGRDGARVRSLMNEIQMLLHEHPANVRRARARQPPVNGWWLWGFGSQAPALGGCASNWSLHADDPWLRALWPTTVWPVAATTAVADTLIASTRPPSPDDVEALAIVDAGLLSWLAKLVRSGQAGTIDVLAGDRVLTVTRSARWQFWRRPASLPAWLP